MRTQGPEEITPSKVSIVAYINGVETSSAWRPLFPTPLNDSKVAAIDSLRKEYPYLKDKFNE